MQDRCRRNRHLPIEAQHDYLVRAIQGDCACCRLTGNDKPLRRFRYRAERIWRTWLACRRLQRMTWDRMNELLKRHPILPVSIPR